MLNLGRFWIFSTKGSVSLLSPIKSLSKGFVFKNFLTYSFNLVFTLRDYDLFIIFFFSFFKFLRLRLKFTFSSPPESPSLCSLFFFPGISSNHMVMSVILKGTPFIQLVTHSISFLRPFLSLSFPLFPLSLDYSSSNVS